METTESATDLSAALVFESYIELVKELAAHNLRLHGGLTPAAFVVSTRHPETGQPLPEPAIYAVGVEGRFDDVAKEKFINTIRGLCIKTRAIGVISAAESWMRYYNERTPIMSLTDLHGELPQLDEAESMIGFVPEQADSIECIMLTAEHVAWGPGCRMIMGTITRTGQEVSVSEWKALAFGDRAVTGRLSGMLDYVIEGCS